MSDRIGRLLPLVGGGLLVAVGLWATLASLRAPISPYDEGIVLTDAFLNSLGQAPYRDFYSNYPPGVFLLIAGLWKVLGVSVAVERAVGLAAHLGIAVGGGWLAARLRGGRFSALAAGVILIWLAWLGTLAFAWLVALALAVVTCALLLSASERGTPQRWMLAGATLGAIGCFRHDLLVYFSITLVALGAVHLVAGRRVTPTGPERRAVGTLAAGAALPLILVWMPTLVRGGFGQVLHDLYFTQVRWILPARTLPMPELLSLTPTTGLPFGIPPFLVHNFEGAVALSLIGPLVALGALVWAPRLGLSGRTGPALVLALSLAVLPQMLGRTDVHHAIFTVAPSLIVLCALAESLPCGSALVRGLVAVAAVGVLVSPARTHWSLTDPGTPAAWQAAYPRYGGLPEPEAAREAVLAFIAAETDPGDPIYVGLTDHRRVWVNEVDLYFLADRPGATRIMQFDPNVVNREEVQREMATQIEERRTRVAILSARYAEVVEPNESVTAGSSYLDDYLAETFEVVEVVGPYRLLRRRSP